MIPQLVQQIAATTGDLPGAQADVLTADPLDLVLRMEQVWDRADLWAQTQPPAGPARRALFDSGAFAAIAMPDQPAWDHLIYAYAIENTRGAQILARVVRAFRNGEGLGVPSVPTQRWLDATEALLFNAANPFAAWLSTSGVRPDAEAVRRNAYYRLVGMDLAHGTDANGPYPFDKAEAANRGFVKVFEELLFELWRAIENVRNRIYRLSEQLGFMLRSRRIGAVLGREELAATTAMGWVELTVSSNTSAESDPGALLRLQEYATAAGAANPVALAQEFATDRQFWSAAFVCHVFRKAGVRPDEFTFNIGHDEYIKHAHRQRAARSTLAHFWLCTLQEVAPEVGDILCSNRDGGNLTYTPGMPNGGLPTDFVSHGDIVTGMSVNSTGDPVLVTTGGNVGDSVRRRFVPVDAAFRVTATSHRGVEPSNQRPGRYSVIVRLRNTIAEVYA